MERVAGSIEELSLLRHPGAIMFVSCYELGHQPLHVASPAGALAQAGHDARCLDLSVQRWDELGPEAVDWAEAVAFSVPMHVSQSGSISVCRQSHH